MNREYRSSTPAVDIVDGVDGSLHKPRVSLVDPRSRSSIMFMEASMNREYRRPPWLKSPMMFMEASINREYRSSAPAVEVVNDVHGKLHELRVSLVDPRG